MPAIASMAAWKASSFALDGLLKPVIFLTNWSEAARTSSGVTGGSKLKRVLIFRHIFEGPPCWIGVPQSYCLHFTQMRSGAVISSMGNGCNCQKPAPDGRSGSTFRVSKMHLPPLSSGASPSRKKFYRLPQVIDDDSHVIHSFERHASKSTQCRPDAAMNALQRRDEQTTCRCRPTSAALPCSISLEDLQATASLPNLLLPSSAFSS